MLLHSDGLHGASEDRERWKQRKDVKNSSAAEDYTGDDKRHYPLLRCDPRPRNDNVAKKNNSIKRKIMRVQMALGKISNAVRATNPTQIRHCLLRRWFQLLFEICLISIRLRFDCD